MARWRFCVGRVRTRAYLPAEQPGEKRTAQYVPVGTRAASQRTTGLQRQPVHCLVRAHATLFAACLPRTVSCLRPSAAHPRAQSSQALT